jgi:hypothetical protein
MYLMLHELWVSEAFFYPRKACAPCLRECKKKGSGTPSKIWSVEEVTPLKELEKTYKNHRFPNVEISKILTSKTIDQIKYKKKETKVS